MWRRAAEEESTWPSQSCGTKAFLLPPNAISGWDTGAGEAQGRQSKKAAASEETQRLFPGEKPISQGRTHTETLITFLKRAAGNPESHLAIDMLPPTSGVTNFPTEVMEKLHLFLCQRKGLLLLQSSFLVTMPQLYTGYHNPLLFQKVSWTLPHLTNVLVEKKKCRAPALLNGVWQIWAEYPQDKNVVKCNRAGKLSTKQMVMMLHVSFLKCSGFIVRNTPFIDFIIKSLL